MYYENNELHFKEELIFTDEDVYNFVEGLETLQGEAVDRVHRYLQQEYMMMDKAINDIEQGITDSIKLSNIAFYYEPALDLLHTDFDDCEPFPLDGFSRALQERRALFVKLLTKFTKIPVSY